MGVEVAMFPDMLRKDRERWGINVGEAGWRLGITLDGTQGSAARTRGPTVS